MSSCACRRWGPGTTCEKQVSTESSRELEAKIKALQEERGKQNNFWIGGSNVYSCPPSIPIINESMETRKNQSISKLNSNAPCKITEAPPQQIRFWN
jgi:hypothetical protein